MDCTGAVALVTGGAKRVGRAIVSELAAAGCDVAVHFRDSQREAEDAVRCVRQLGRRSISVRAELGDPAEWRPLVDRAVSELGALDLLVNNASLFLTDLSDDIESFDVSHWERMLRVNLLAPAALCHYASSALRAGGRGVIVNLCDISAERPWSRHLAYCASKAGLVNLTRSLAKALAPQVRVVGVAPGIAIFPEQYDQQIRQRRVERVPMGRGGSPEEVAKLVRFLVESGDYVTGQVVAIDGGRMLA